MDVLDIFNGNAYNAISMTETINLLPHTPTRIQQMGLFQEAGITTPTLVINEKKGELMLLPTAGRGSMPTFNQEDKQRLRSFVVPHIPKNDDVMADELIGLRHFGEGPMAMSDTPVATVVAEKLAKMRAEHELTWEWHRIGAVKGVVLDADGTNVVYDWFQEFGITKKVETYNPANANDLARICRVIKRHMADTLGATVLNGIHCFVGSDFMDAMSTDTFINEAFARWRDGEHLRSNFAYEGFYYQGVTFEEYRGQLGTTRFVDADKAHAFPTGTNRFLRRNAPGSMIEAVGTVGQQMYASQERKRHGQGIDIHTQSNPIFVCSQPGVLVELTL